MCCTEVTIDCICMWRVMRHMYCGAKRVHSKNWLNYKYSPSIAIIIGTSVHSLKSHEKTSINPGRGSWRKHSKMAKKSVVVT